MNLAILQAIQLVLIAAVINAVYTLPMKFNKHWKWEHSWLALRSLVSPQCRPFCPCLRFRD